MRGEHCICEYCGKPFLGDVYHIRLTVTSSETGEEYDCGRENDLCAKCAKKLSKWKPDAPVKSRMWNLKKIDHSKAYALKRSGWPNSRIADEFGVSEKTITLALATIYKEMAEGKLIIEGVNGYTYSGVQGRSIEE